MASFIRIAFFLIFSIHCINLSPAYGDAYGDDSYGDDAKEEESASKEAAGEEKKKKEEDKKKSDGEKKKEEEENKEAQEKKKKSQSEESKAEDKEAKAKKKKEKAEKESKKAGKKANKAQKESEEADKAAEDAEEESKKADKELEEAKKSGDPKKIKAAQKKKKAADKKKAKARQKANEKKLKAVNAQNEKEAADERRDIAHEAHNDATAKKEEAQSKRKEAEKDAAVKRKAAADKKAQEADEELKRAKESGDPKKIKEAEKKKKAADKEKEAAHKEHEKIKHAEEREKAAKKEKTAKAEHDHAKKEKEAADKKVKDAEHRVKNAKTKKEREAAAKELAAAKREQREKKKVFDQKKKNLKEAKKAHKKVKGPGRFRRAMSSAGRGIARGAKAIGRGVAKGARAVGRGIQNKFQRKKEDPRQGDEKDDVSSNQQPVYVEEGGEYYARPGFPPPRDEGFDDAYAYNHNFLGGFGKSPFLKSNPNLIKQQEVHEAASVSRDETRDSHPSDSLAKPWAGENTERDSEPKPRVRRGGVYMRDDSGVTDDSYGALDAETMHALSVVASVFEERNRDEAPSYGRTRNYQKWQDEIEDISDSKRELLRSRNRGEISRSEFRARYRDLEDAHERAQDRYHDALIASSLTGGRKIKEAETGTAIDDWSNAQDTDKYLPYNPKSGGLFNPDPYSSEDISDFIESDENVPTTEGVVTEESMMDDGGSEENPYERTFNTNKGNRIHESGVQWKTTARHRTMGVPESI